jgi:isopentenyldiphosphate isomerase
MSLVQLVDEHDRVIGSKERGELDPATDIYRSAALWVKNTAGEILIARRSEAKAKDPGKWGPAVAGTVDAGESYEQNIVKEAAEELGLTNLAIKSTQKIFMTTTSRYFIQWFVAITDVDPKTLKLQADEVSEVKFVSRTDLIEDVTTHPERYVPSFPLVIDKLVAN